MTPEISLILPAYNEARVIAATIGEAVRYFDSRGWSYQIIVAADGADGTREIVRQMALANIRSWQTFYCCDDFTRHFSGVVFMQSSDESKKDVGGNQRAV